MPKEDLEVTWVLSDEVSMAVSYVELPEAQGKSWGRIQITEASPTFHFKMLTSS